MRIKFIKKCDCDDPGYIKLEESETDLDITRDVQYGVFCRKCGRPWKEGKPKGFFVPIDKGMTVRDKPKENSKPVKPKAEGKVNGKVKPKAEGKKSILGVVFDKDRNK